MSFSDFSPAFDSAFLIYFKILKNPAFKLGLEKPEVTYEASGASQPQEWKQGVHGILQS